MTDTIYTLFKRTVQEHKDEAAIVENERTMTFAFITTTLYNLFVAFSFPS